MAFLSNSLFDWTRSTQFGDGIELTCGAGGSGRATESLLEHRGNERDRAGESPEPPRVVSRPSDHSGRIA